MSRKILLLLFLVGLTGCATSFENVPLQEGEKNIELHSYDVADKNRPIILLAFSGGGIRASALSWSILKELAQYSYTSAGETRPLADDISVISSASGGSVTAAYFGLYGTEGLDRFEADFLTQENMSSLLSDAANPFTWFDLAAIGESRSSLVAKMFDEKLFKQKTFADMNVAGKPFVVLNATDMASGEIFPFTADRFDDICSDLNALPISTAVASSAAVPIVLSPMSFRNYSVTECQNRPVPQWITTKLEGKYAPYLNVEEFKRARYVNDLRRGSNRYRDIQYLYLVDGGLADNLGLGSLKQAIISAHNGESLLRHINDGDVRRLVVIVVNSRSDANSALYQSSDRPGVFSMIGSVTTIPIDSTTANVNGQMDNLLAEIRAASATAPKTAKFKGLEVYGIQIDFDQLRANKTEQRLLRDQAKAIPTSWTMSEHDLGIIKQVGPLLLHQHPCFQKLLMDLDIKADFINAPFANTGCPTKG